MRRSLGYLILVAAAFYVPKAFSTGEFTSAMKKLLRTGEARQDGATSLEGERLALGAYGVELHPTSYSGGSPGTGQARPTPPIPAPAVTRELLPLDKFLRFDVTPEWVTTQFERVSVLPTIGGDAMRVALITGTRVTDLAGSLTYHFDEQQLVQRISLQAVTGDPRPLVQFVEQHYKLKELQPDVYISQYNRVVISGLMVQRSRVIQRDRPQGNTTILLELNRPNQAGPGVSEEFHRQLTMAAAS
ncbi:MAG: hypothetical protein KDB14_09270 [Planctomycetales bacterium]|nr:hypothetical protein [Planctomycetales bacterium]